MKKYLVIGYGGIGAAICNKVINNDDHLVVVTRKKITNTIHHISFDDLPRFFKSDIPDFIVNTIGVLHTSDHQPEKNISQLSEEWLMESMKINVMPTAIIAQYLSPFLRSDTSLKMISLSARLSSLSDNRLGGWYSYRMSKAALNMLIKNIAIEWARLYPHVGVFGYHPGTVDTPLSKPFQSRISSDKLFTPEQAADYLLTVLHQLTEKESGGLYDWQGKLIPY